jgi:hypothetical protein
MSTDDDRTAEYLRWLSWGYFVMGGMYVLGMCIPVVYFILGVALLSGVQSPPTAGPPPMVDRVIGWTLVVIALAAALLIPVTAVLQLLTGWKIRNARAYRLCLGTAIWTATLFPLGTVLGVLTLVVLQQPSAKRQFGRPAAPAARSRDQA